jgi:integrase
MSVYSVTGKGWRFDFTQKGARCTEAWFKTKKEALRAEAIKKEGLKNPQVVKEAQIDMDFFELVNLKLDHIKAYNSKHHYVDHVYRAKRWVKIWGKLKCNELTTDMIEKFVLRRNRVSANVANREIRALRAMFNFGKKRKVVESNPVDDIDFLPVEKRLKYVPSVSDIDKVVSVAPPEAQDYLICICDTMARVSEINGLTWQDVNFEEKFVVLYTRKKKGGHLTPRKIPMTNRLYTILQRRFSVREKSKPWIFWHRYYNRNADVWEEGPFKDRKRMMQTLCKKAEVKYFRYHALRHAGASMMDNNNVPIGAIQSILGHENRTTTEIYLHNLGGVEKEAISVYESVRGFSHTDSHT